MSKNLILNELINAVMYDCYNYLLSISSDSVKDSINDLLEKRKYNVEIIRVSYVVFCFIYHLVQKDEDIINIEFFARNYLCTFYDYLWESDNILKNEATCLDICNAYIALKGFREFCVSSLDKEILKFNPDDYPHFYSLLTLYNKIEIVKNFYEININVLYNKVNQYDLLATEWVKNYKNENSIRILNFVIKNDKEKKTEMEIKDLREKFQLLMNNYKLLAIKSEINDINKKEQIVISQESISSIQSVSINKMDYLDNNINLLENTVKNIINPYNFNLWRKISNIILKNIFIILIKKGHVLSQRCSQSILKELERRYKSTDISNQKSYEIKIKNYKDSLKAQKKLSKVEDAPSADKKRTFNIIVISNKDGYDVNASLSIDFLFYIKENGSKADHFDEDILDLILFEDLNIKEIVSFENNIEEENKEEIKIDNKEKKYKGKTLFKGKELINMLITPQNYKKKDFKIDELSQDIYDEINSLINKIHSIDNIKNMSELINLSTNIKNRLNLLIDECEKDFNKKNINFSNENEIMELGKKDGNLMEAFISYKEMKNLKNKMELKLKLYNEINDNIRNIAIKKKKFEKYINELINENNKKMKEKVEIYDMHNLFKKYKADLLNKIDKEEEYKYYQTIFNNNNIKNFTLTDFLNFLKSQIDDETLSFSIIKRDIKNFNLLVEVIVNFPELNPIYKNYLDVKI